MIAFVVNLPVGLALACAAGLFAFDPDLYSRVVQEDEALEWSTFWAFVAAAALFVLAARAERGRTGRLPWFFAGLALFCTFVAFEEISWGQRVLGYRPPDYLLEHNFQQEMNLHNVVESGLRKAAFLAVVLGYGVALPVAVRFGGLRRWIEGAGITAPPMVLAPSFAITGGLQIVYPWSHTGEWAELMLGLGMAISALLPHRRSAVDWSTRTVAARVLGGALAIVVLGWTTAEAFWLRHGARPETLEAARIELEALRRDVASARTRTQCGLHRRLYTLAVRSDQRHLLAGAFAGLTEQGLPASRAEFLLDPWNSPYWIRHVCAEDWSRRAIYVYSFGPNRRRDSSDWEIVPDDLVGWISRPEPAEASAD